MFSSDSKTSISGKVGRKVDIWSVGVTMLEMVHTGKPPLFELEPFQYMFQLCNKKEPPVTPDFVNPRLQLIISSCLVYDSDKRGTADDILRLWQYDDDKSYSVPDDNYDNDDHYDNDDGFEVDYDYYTDRDADARNDDGFKVDYDYYTDRDADARNDDGFEVDYDYYQDRDDARNDDGFEVDYDNYTSRDI